MMDSAIGANQGAFGDNHWQRHGRSRDASAAAAEGDSKPGFVDGREALLTVAHNHCMYSFVKAGRWGGYSFFPFFFIVSPPYPYFSL